MTSSLYFSDLVVDADMSLLLLASVSEVAYYSCH